LCLEPTIEVDAKTPAVVGQSVTFTMDLKRYPDSIPLPMCLIYFGDRKSDLVRECRYSISAKFYFPGTYNFKSDCRLNAKRFQASGKFRVEANLKRPPLGLWFAKADQNYMEAVDLTFTHTYTFPIYYHLTVEDLSLTYVLPTFDSDKFTDESTTTRRFLLSQENQALLGPGKHQFTMVMENNVSAIILTDEFTLIEPISRVQIATAKLVGIHPYPFTITVTVGSGAPVYVTIKVVRGPANQSISQMTTSCKNRCPTLLPTATLPGPGADYEVNVFASNDISSVHSSYRSFTAMPLIYDVFVTSSKPLVIGPNNKVLFFVRGDLGGYAMTIHVNHQKRGDTHFKITSISNSYDVGAAFPMDPQPYTMISVPVKFEASGEMSVHITIANAIKTMYFERKLHVLYEFDCDIALRIRDANMKPWPNDPVLVDSVLHLSSDARCLCKSDARLSYKWDVFRVTLQELARFEQVKLKQEFIGPDFVLDTSSFQPGFYVIELDATIFDQRHWQAIGFQQDFAFVKVERQKPTIAIEGGSQRQIGKFVLRCLDFDLGTLVSRGV